MINKKKLSIILLTIGIAFIGFGIFRMYAPAAIGELVHREDTLGISILSIGAVMAIFATGSMVGEKSSQE